MEFLEIGVNGCVCSCRCTFGCFNFVAIKCEVLYQKDSVGFRMTTPTIDLHRLVRENDAASLRDICSKGTCDLDSRKEIEGQQVVARSSLRLI